MSSVEICGSAFKRGVSFRHRTQRERAKDAGRFVACGVGRFRDRVVGLKSMPASLAAGYSELKRVIAGVSVRSDQNSFYIRKRGGVSVRRRVKRITVGSIRSC